MGRTKTSTVRLPPESEWRPYMIEPTGPLSWPQLFLNDRAVEVEIGSGKGLFLISAATLNPRRNFVGIEIARKFAEFSAGRLAEKSVANARILCGDARRVFSEWLVPASVAAVHVYFPDPWWKRRHRKRRIFNAGMVATIATALAPGGALHVASDVEPYFREIQAFIAAYGAFRPMEPPPPHDAADGVESLTNFERKYRRVGKPIWRGDYQYTPEPAAETPRHATA
jgi:tRNA (guanine-N7-)-methyltransferase